MSSNQMSRRRAGAQIQHRALAAVAAVAALVGMAWAIAQDQPLPPAAQPAVVVSSPPPPVPSPPPPPVPEPERTDEVQKAAILCYHRIADSPSAETVVRPASFERQLKYLAEHDYTVLHLSEVQNAFKEGIKLPARTVVLTFDDGFRTDYEIVWPLLQKYDVPATLFIYPNWTGQSSGALTWDQLREMVESGLVEVGSHSLNHADLVKAANSGKLGRELSGSIERIEAELGVSVTALAYPYGRQNSTVRAATAKAGYTCGLLVNGALARSDGDPLRMGRLTMSRSDSLEVFARERLAGLPVAEEGGEDG